MGAINGHTCVGDDGGTPNRRCDACEMDRGREPVTVNVPVTFMAYEVLAPNWPEKREALLANQAELNRQQLNEEVRKIKRRPFLKGITD